MKTFKMYDVEIEERGHDIAIVQDGEDHVILLTADQAEIVGQAIIRLALEIKRERGYVNQVNTTEMKG